MNRKVLFLSFLTALSGSCGGCAFHPPEIRPSGKATVRVNPEERPTRATVQLANEVTIVLPVPEPAGYVWQISQHNAATLRQLGGFATDPTGETTISFLALRMGSTRLLFALVPPTNQAILEPADVREVQLTIE